MRQKRPGVRGTHLSGMRMRHASIRYVSLKRGLYMRQKSPSMQAKQAYFCGKRGLYMRQKRPTIQAKQAYSHTGIPIRYSCTSARSKANFLPHGVSPPPWQEKKIQKKNVKDPYPMGYRRRPGRKKNLKKRKKFKRPLPHGVSPPPWQGKKRSKDALKNISQKTPACVAKRPCIEIIEAWQEK